MEGYGGLVHSDYSDYIIQERQRVPPKERQEVAAAVHSLLFLVRRQQLGDPSGGLLYEAQIVLEDGVNGPN